MISLLVYLIVLSLTIFSSLSVCILCAAKIVQLSRNDHIFDPELSPGQRIRKLFLVAIGASNGTRCISASLEFILFAINVVKEDKPASSISYYHGFHSTAGRIVFVSRVLPTLLFFAYYSLARDYLGNLYHLLCEVDYRVARAGFILVDLATALAVVYFLIIDPCPGKLYASCLVAVLLFAVWIARYAYGIHYFYVSNEDVLSETVPTNQGKLMARLARVVVVALIALLSYAIVYGIELMGLFPNRSFYGQSVADLVVVLFSEVSCAWILVNLLSNNLVSLEGQLQQFCGEHIIRAFSRSAGSGSAGNTFAMTAANGSGSAADRSSLRTTPPLRSAALLQAQQKLQQQELLRRYGNYQSITVADDDPAAP